MPTMSSTSISWYILGPHSNCLSSSHFRLLEANRLWSRLSSNILLLLLLVMFGENQLIYNITGQNIVDSKVLYSRNWYISI